jgi:hypothetical protein
MKILRLLLALLALPLLPAHAQEVEPPEGARIASVHVSGFDLTKLSAALQEEINALRGRPLNRRDLNALAARIETEHPQHIAGVRASQEPDGGARVVFVVARMRDQERAANINSRYVVEDVDVRGIAERDLDRALRDDLHALAGRPLDSEEADRLEARLRASLPDYDVVRRTVRGSQPGRIRLVFDGRRPEWARWLRFEPLDANLVYHSEQGWGASLPLSMAGRHVLISPTFVIDDGDDLIEEYGGFALRAESRKVVGTERLGAFFEWSTFDQTWREPTLAALARTPGAPRPYRNRMSVTPLLKFAITRQLSVGGGVRVTELDPFPEGDESQMANAVIGSVVFSQASRPGSGPRQSVDANFTVRAGTEALESDLVYERYVGAAGYAFRQDHHLVRASAMAGRIAGDAPLFERFALGDSRTLRGWNKYDIAAAGGTRMFHASLEYQYRGLGMFLDAGSVWDAAAERRVRVSTGVTFSPGPAFFTVGFPLNTDEFGAVFTMGVRFSRAALGITRY